MVRKIRVCSPLLCFLACIGLVLSACEAPTATPTPTYHAPRLSASGAIALVLERVPARIRPIVGLNATYQGNGLWHVFSPGPVLSNLYISGPLWHVYEDTLSALPENDEALGMERRWFMMDQIQQQRSY